MENEQKILCKAFFLICNMAVMTTLFSGCGTENIPAGPGGNNTPLEGMRLIAGGTFQMGRQNPDLGCTGCARNEQPAHTVTVQSFYMDTVEVTQADYKGLMGVNPAYFTSPMFTDDSMLPVEMVSWFDAALYCNKRSKRGGLDTVYSYKSANFYGNWCTNLSGLAIDFSKSGCRLPTEAEWEYACRAGTSTDYFWGRNYPPITQEDTMAIDVNAVWQNDFIGDSIQAITPQPIATKKPNAWGFYDMVGNVFEWCNDWYDSTYYKSSGTSNPAGPDTGTFRVTRASPCASPAFALASSFRAGGRMPGGRYSDVGFRCVQR